VRIVAVDPGAHSIAWAAFEETRLRGCDFDEAGDRQELAGKIHQRMSRLLRDGFQAVIELPQIYDQRRWRGDPNDLVMVAVTVGMVAQVMNGRAELVHPHDWKGSRSKEIDHPVTLGLLDETELHILESVKVLKSKHHNILDAIGIGLWKVGRR